MAGVVLYGPTGNPLIPASPAIVDCSHSALRVSLRPIEHAYPGFVGGHYRAVGSTTAIAAAANAVLAAFRFAPTNNQLVCIPLRIRATMYVVTAVTAQRVDPLVALVARGYTVADPTNLAAVVLTGNNAKIRTGFSTPIAALGMANAAAGISAGTKALDATPFGHLPLSGAAAIAGLGTGASGDLYQAIDHGQHPLTLGGAAGPEGFVVQNGAAAIASGTVITTVEVEWVETLLF